MTETPTQTPAEPKPPYRQLDEIPGWFLRMDMEVFDQLLRQTEDRLGGGDLAELGAYLGKSAALIGWHQQPGETFTVIDLFEQEASAEENRAENEDQYAELSQEAFEKYYLTVHDTLPVVVRGPSASVLDHAPHTPGVAAAVWQATTQDLRPFAVTMNKLYATFDDSQPWLDVLTAWLDERGFWRQEIQQVSGQPLLRLRRPPKKSQPQAAQAEPDPAPRRWWQRG